LTGMWGDELTTRGAPSAWTRSLSKASSIKKNFSASMTGLIQSNMRKIQILFPAVLSWDSPIGCCKIAPSHLHQAGPAREAVDQAKDRPHDRTPLLITDGSDVGAIAFLAFFVHLQKWCRRSSRSFHLIAGRDIGSRIRDRRGAGMGPARSLKLAGRDDGIGIASRYLERPEVHVATMWQIVGVFPSSDSARPRNAANAAL